MKQELGGKEVQGLLESWPLTAGTSNLQDAVQQDGQRQTPLQAAIVANSKWYDATRSPGVSGAGRLAVKHAVQELQRRWPLAALASCCGSASVKPGRSAQVARSWP